MPKKPTVSIKYTTQPTFEFNAQLNGIHTASGALSIRPIKWDEPHVVNGVELDNKYSINWFCPDQHALNFFSKALEEQVGGTAGLAEVAKDLSSIRKVGAGKDFFSNLMANYSRKYNENEDTSLQKRLLEASNLPKAITELNFNLEGEDIGNFLRPDPIAPEDAVNTGAALKILPSDSGAHEIKFTGSGFRGFNFGSSTGYWFGGPFGNVYLGKQFTVVEDYALYVRGHGVLHFIGTDAVSYDPTESNYKRPPGLSNKDSEIRFGRGLRIVAGDTIATNSPTKPSEFRFEPSESLFMKLSYKSASVDDSELLSQIDMRSPSFHISNQDQGKMAASGYRIAANKGDLTIYGSDKVSIHAGVENSTPMAVFDCEEGVVLNSDSGMDIAAEFLTFDSSIANFKVSGVLNIK